MEAPIVRNEFKYDVFRSEFPEILGTIERTYEEIDRPTPATLTLFFYHPELGPPEVDTHFRLRTYAHLDPATATLEDIKALPWHIERKDGQFKERLGKLDALPPSTATDHEAYDLLGMIRRPNLLKVSQRRHFAVESSGDESHRITTDLSRTILKVIDHRLQRLGDMSPRVEVKLPVEEPEDSLPISGRLRAAGHWTPFAAMERYFQFLLRHSLPMETHTQLPEIEAKHAITAGEPDEIFDQLHSWLLTKQEEWRLLLPFPHSIARVRRYHVCEGPDAHSTATVVETAAGRCSLKIKRYSQQQGSALLRDTDASHTTYLDGAMMMPDEFVRTRGLTKLNEFTKSQRKIPVALSNGLAFQFSLDHCTDPSGRRLDQIEIEFIGSTDGHLAPIEQVLEEIDGVARELMASPLGTSLEPTHVSKHAFFT